MRPETTIVDNYGCSPKMGRDLLEAILSNDKMTLCHLCNQVTGIVFFSQCDYLIDNEGAKTLSQALQNNQTVRTVILIYNAIRTEGALEFLRLLQSNTNNVEILDLDCNHDDRIDPKVLDQIQQELHKKRDTSSFQRKTKNAYSKRLGK